MAISSTRATARERALLGGGPRRRRARIPAPRGTAPRRAARALLLAVGCYMWDDERDSYVAAVLDVLTIRGTQIDEVTAFVAPWVFRRFGDVSGVMTPDMFRRFGLADELPA